MVVIVVCLVLWLLGVLGIWHGVSLR